MTTIYRNFDQQQLDHEYDGSSHVSAEYLANLRKVWQAQSEEARATLSCDLDLEYGDSAGQQLDIFRPAAAGKSPVQIYIHGGYWSSNDKNVCSYTALGLTRLGFATVVVNYDLVPVVRIADQVDQLRKALVWTYRNIGTFGGDPAQIGIIGHSAGGHLAMMLAASDYSDLAPELPRDAVKSILCLSGIYEMEPIRLSKVNAILNLSAEEVPPISPIRLKRWLQPYRVLLAAGDGEGEEFARQAAAMRLAWAQELGDIRSEVLPGHNHFSIRAALADHHSDVSQLVLSLSGTVPNT